MSDADISWFYNYDGNKKGPFKANEIDALIRAGVVDEHTKVWSEILGEWTPLFRTELRTLLGDKTIQPPPLPESPPLGLTTAPPALFPQPLDPAVGAGSGWRGPAAQTGTFSAAPHAASYPLRDNRTLGKVLYWLIWINFAISFIQAGLIVKTKGGIEAQYRKAMWLETDNTAIAITILPFLVTIVIFLWWKYRSTANLFHLRGPQTITPAGAVYWYFVPIAWFWKPYEAMRNLVNGYHAKDDKSLLQTWWLLFWGGIAAVILMMIIMPDPVRTLSDARTYVWGYIVSYGLDALWCWIASKLVKEIVAAEAKALGQI